MTAKPRLTDEQRAAISATGHTLLVANAGTGKTTTIVQKILWLLGFDIGDEVSRVAEPCRLDEIAAITFTEKAAYDLKHKLREEIAEREGGGALLWELEQASLGTIHSFCGQLLRDNALRLGIDPTFSVLDEQEARLRQDQLLRDVIIERLQADDEDVGELVRTYKLEGMGEWGRGTLDLARSAFRDVRWRCEAYDLWCQGGELDVAELKRRYAMSDANDEVTLARCRALYRIADRALKRWHEQQVRENIRDFDSLILDARDLLCSEAGEAALTGIRGRYRILIIDEFQDTDDAQRDIAYAIARHVPRPQLFLVGDPKQSIYRFRGANIAVWNEVQADFAQERAPLTLTQNFRSDPRVIDFANAASQVAIEQIGELVAAAGGSRVAYSQLRPGRASEDTGHVEWRMPDGADAADKRTNGGLHLADRIHALVGKEDVVDPETGEPRKCRYADIAVLYRARTDLNRFQDELRRAGIPYYENSPAGLAERQEILDLLNLLRLLANPFDDLRAFAFLRSPFVGLRDEVLARIKFSDLGGSFLTQARRYLKEGEWFAAPEHALVSEVERVALKDGLALFERATRLADRVPVDELLTEVLEASGYRNHLLLLPGYREALANIDAFVRVTEQFRDQSLGGFLELWDDRDPTDPGIPLAQLYSRADDVVTFSTIHAAKGLEWPVVFLINVDSEIRDKSTNEYWSDPHYGPVVCPKKDERGARANLLMARNAAENVAEEARLMYVAVTRARDQLYLIGSAAKKLSYATWLTAGASACDVPLITDEPNVPVVLPLPPIDLKWLDVVQPGDAAESSAALVRPPHRWMTSATEMMSKLRDEQVWKLMYLHGVEPHWLFAPGGKGKALPENVRGTIIHGVLERISENVEIAQILEETIGELGAPELEMVLAPGSQYRGLEREIERVVSSPEWAWYVEGEHHRELPFLYLAGEREWYVGAFDLYRPDGWIIDFKTHQISAASVDATAEKYRVQMELYRRAAGIIGPVRTQLHFTHPGVVVEIK